MGHYSGIGDQNKNSKVSKEGFSSTVICKIFRSKGAVKEMNLSTDHQNQ